MTRLVAPVLARVAVVAGLMTLVAIVGIAVSGAAVDRLDDELRPAVASNQAVLQDLTSMSAAVEAWSSTGRGSAADDYQQALVQLPAHEQTVREYAAGDRELTALAEGQERAAQTWIAEYAGPRMDAEGGTPASGAEIRKGTAAFDDLRAANRATTEALESRVRSSTDAMSWLLKGTALAVLAVALVGYFVVARSRRKLMAELSQPLLDLEKVVSRMRDEPDVRAKPAGPKEVQAIAQAINDLADAQSRAKAVEVWIQKEMRTLDTAKDDFVSNVSHELRTPLTTISGYLEMVAEEFEDALEPRHERMLEATRRNVARLKMLIDDLLTLSQAEGRASQMEVIDLTGLVREVVMDVKITAARRGIEIGVVTPVAPVAVLADRAMLHRAFLNVVTNAVKFSHDDGRVRVELRADGAEVAVAVTDEGIGIPASEIDRLGTRFFRASNAVTNEIAGTGLGVRMTQTIVDKHQGSVLFSSEEGAGTTVTVRLPQQSASVPTVTPIPITRTPVPVPTPRALEPVPAPAVTRETSPEPSGEVDPADAGELPRIVPAFARRRS
ncbi:sensor histidine kinase [Nocardioides mangrovi]|uniref:histidine kinase n=1 Tax=Nocardioides mangrovi TaxID=2874580 RepID=A0ABS7U6Y0_9ACTN|nr:ATP-binding protein [Nocardioides mangrovi]MBZ5736577.1 HAMP domain-containing histidine kinase [Nocardioides mangrovi]